MLARFVSSGLVLAVVVVGLALPASAQDDRERARAEFQRGVDAYGSGDYQRSLDAFQEAYRLAPHPMVRVNIANSYERLGRPLEALFHFERFLAETERATPQQRREVEAAIRRLRQQVGEIELHVTPDGALVTIDGAEQRRAPITDAVRVTVGLHTLEIRLDGYQTERRQVQVRGGETQRVEVRLARAEAVASSGGGSSGGASAAASTGEGATASAGAASAGGGVEGSSAGAEGSSEAVASSSGERTGTTTPVETQAAIDAEPAPEAGAGGGFRVTLPVWIVGGVTVAAAIGAGITGGLALSASSDFDRNVAIYEDPSEPADVRAQAQADGLSAADSARTLAAVSDALLITTIVGAGATAFLLITTQEGGLLDDGGEREGPEVAAVPLAGPGLAGVALLGTF